MSELPRGWVTQQLAKLVVFNPKHDPDLDRNIEVSFVPMPAVDDKTGSILDFSQVKPLADVWKGYTHFQNGDVIFAKITPCMENGKIAVAEGLKNKLACGSTEFHVMRSEGAVEPEFLWRYLRQSSFRRTAEQSMTGAVGQRRVPKQYLEQTELPLPPLAEQKRIVAKLDALSARSARARNDLARIDILVKRYKQAILSKAFSGELTSNVEWRPTPEGMVRTSNRDRLPASWQVCSLAEIAEIQSGLALGKKRKHDAELIELPYLRVANVQRGWLTLEEIKTVEVTEKEAQRLFLKPGDVLMNEGGDRDKLGRGWVWNGEIDNCIHQNHVFRVRLHADALPPKFLSYFANEFGQQHFFSQGKQTTNLASISKTKLSAMNVPVPPFPEAQEIVRRIERAFRKIDRLAAEAQRALALTDRLDEAILARAFRGDLVPQDPADEPASLLLDRIRAERATAPIPKRGRRRSA